MAKAMDSAGKWIAAHRKALAGVVAPVVVVVDTVIAGGAVNWPVLIASVLAALGVYVVPNDPGPTAPTVVS